MRENNEPQISDLKSNLTTHPFTVTACFRITEHHYQSKNRRKTCTLIGCTTDSPLSPRIKLRPEGCGGQPAAACPEGGGGEPAQAQAGGRGQPASESTGGRREEASPQAGQCLATDQPTNQRTNQLRLKISNPYHSTAHVKQTACVNK